MLEIKVNNKSLSISFEGQDKLIFNVGDEIFAVGKGETNYSMNRGTFAIKEHIFEKHHLKIERFAKNDIILEKGKIILKIEDNNIHFIPEGLDGFNMMWFKLPSNKSEGFYGTGEIFTEFNLKGQKATIWVAEHINVKQTTIKMLNNLVGLKNLNVCRKFGAYESYYEQPTFISSNKYFYHSDATARSVFKFDKDQTIIQTDQIAPFWISYAEDFESLMTNLTDIVGRQPELPDWVYDGQILGIQGGTDIMMEKYNKVVAHNGKVNGIWIQDWEGRRVTAVGKQLFWNWEWDKELYPNLDKKIKELNEQGVKVLGYCNPFLAIEKPLYKEATAKGYCVKDNDGNDYLVKITTFPAAMVDLTNPDAYNWIKEIIKKNMIDFGLSGWMADFGEYLPTDSVLFSGENAEYVHNTWPALWAKVNREAVEESGKLGEIMFFTRAGYSGTPKQTLMMWNGDNHPDFSKDFGLPSIVPAMLSLTVCGCGLSHSDIGGYTSIMNLRRNMDVYKRWFEMNAFSPLMRGHEGLNPDINVQFDADDDILEFASKMSRIHAALKPYLKEAVAKNAKEGVGVVRPLFFYYDEKEAYNNGYEYLLGRDILVAPVMRPKATKRKVYLPDDEWIHLWSQQEYKGGTYVIDAPYGQIPVFVRKNAKSNVLEQLLKEI
ncbi:MAG: alpha-glucosidase [Clostridiales bacterium]|nr:alpha-glucosidase [Clostridiales bacterium]